MITSLQKLSFNNNSWRKFSLEKFIVIVLFLVVFISFTNYAYGIDVGTLPFDIAINPTNDRAYVAHADGTVHVINTLTGTDILTIVVSAGKALTGIVVDTDTDKVYVANSGDSTVEVIDGVIGSPTENEVIFTISLSPSGVFPVDVELNTNLDYSMSVMFFLGQL